MSAGLGLVRVLGPGNVALADGTVAFAIVEKGRRYSLYDMAEDGPPLIARSSIAACQAKAEELAASASPTNVPDSEDGRTDAQLAEDEQSPDPTETPIGDGESSGKIESPAPCNPTELKSAAAGRPILGEVIAWTPGEGTRTYAQLTKALADSNLDPAIAKELLPRYAFDRACKKLEAGRIIDRCPEHDLGEVLAFQFTKKYATDTATGKEWAYMTEAILHLDKATGKIWCKDTGLMEQAQRLVNEALETRTAADVTRIVQRLLQG